MGRLAVTGGHGILGTEFAADASRLDIDTMYGSAALLDAGTHVVIQRHGLDEFVSAPFIDHRAHVRALADAGCDRILGVASVGSLRRDLPVGTFVAPDDFIALHLGTSFSDGDEGHQAPGFDPAWRRTVADRWADHTDVPLHDGGVYWQAIGPRFETKAEIRLIAGHADLVGMTIASECVLAGEIGLAYASICVVDNLANGIGEAPLTMEEFRAGAAANRDRLVGALDAVLPALSKEAGELVSLTVRDARLDGAVVVVRVEGDRIVAIGTDVESEAGDDVLDAAGMALVPGLVNGHTHAAMTLMRGYGGDLPLMKWLQDKIFPVEAKLTADDVYWGTRLACVEMIRSGTVRFWDMYWQPEAVARAVQDAGIRASVELPLVDNLDAGKSDALRVDAERSLDALDDAGPRVTRTLGPHSIYLVSEKSLHWIAELSSERGLRVHIHLSETEGEVHDCLAAHGVRPAPYLDRIGLLTERTILAHGVWLDDDELALVGERGATIVTNPVSNLKLAVGRVFPYAKARRHRIPVGLGTDGASSNNSLDLFQDVKHLALVQKQVERDPAAMPATEAWAVATGQRAPVLGQPGRLTAGDPADFLLVRSDAPELTPGDLTANLVYAAAGSVVDTTVVAGQVLMRGGEIGDEAEVRAGAMASARRLGVIE